MPTGELETLKRETIQSQVRSEGSGGLTLLYWLAGGENLISPWWSTARDKQLRAFWRKPDHLAGAVYTLSSRLSTIPVKVVPQDTTIRSSVAQADKFQYILDNMSEFGQGFDTFISKWVEDLVTQDNGAFAEIIGDGDPTGPIIGAPYGIASLDSARCMRTSDPEFPVIYTDAKDGRFKLHYTRVAFASLQPSPQSEMLGVGYCSVSRCLNTAQHLLDISIYKQEKLGSRPHRSIIVTKGGLDPADVQAAFQLGEEKIDNAALTRYSKSIVMGNANYPDADLSLIDLASLPDGFNEETSTTLGMAAIALAFGVDARELWPATVSGATRADALVSHLKARMKGIGQIIQITERAIGPKLLPGNLRLIFDYQDDAQDHEVANIRKVRSETHSSDLASEVVDVRTARQQMVADGDLTQPQYEELELEDGRLADGSPVLMLFYDPDFKDMLNLGLPDPLLLEDVSSVQPIIDATRAGLLKSLAVLTNYRQRTQVKQALAALKALEDRAEDVAGQEAIANMQEAVAEDGTQPPPEGDAQENLTPGDESMTDEQASEATMEPAAE